MLGLPHNCEVCGIDFVGTIVFAGVVGEDFADFPIGFQNFKKMFWGAVGVTIPQSRLASAVTAPLTQGSLPLRRKLCKAKAFWNHQHCWWFSFHKKNTGCHAFLRTAS